MSKPILSNPRHSHYFLGHEAFRQAAEQNLDMFFKIMASEVHDKFVEQVLLQTNQLPGDDEVFQIEQLSFTPCSIESRPALVIQLPEPKAYIECFYCAVVGVEPIKEGEGYPAKNFDYFTLELGEGETNSAVSMFCKWEGDTHYNLGEAPLNLTAEDFSELITTFYRTRESKEL